MQGSSRSRTASWWPRSDLLSLCCGADQPTCPQMKITSAFGAFLDPVADKIMCA